MNGALWTDLHGGATHLPIAFTLGALGCDAAALWRWNSAAGPRLRAAGAYAVWAAAAGVVPAVVSGVLLARGRPLGEGALRWHHLFAWPAFGLIVGAAIWRGLTGSAASRRVHARYTLVVAAAAGCVVSAGYFGGELLKSFP